MIYITFNLNPLPLRSVKLKILPPDIHFKILVVGCPTVGFFVFAETAIPMNAAATLASGFKNLFQADCVPLKIF